MCAQTVKRWDYVYSHTLYMEDVGGRTEQMLGLLINELQCDKVSDVRLSL